MDSAPKPLIPDLISQHRGLFLALASGFAVGWDCAAGWGSRRVVVKVAGLVWRSPARPTCTRFCPCKERPRIEIHMWLA